VLALVVSVWPLRGEGMSPLSSGFSHVIVPMACLAVWWGVFGCPLLANLSVV